MTAEAEGDAFTLAAIPPLEPDIDHFIFCRHGQTAGNFTRIIQGPDIELNETGLPQAEAAGERLKSVAFHELFCSDMRPAKRSAALSVGQECVDTSRYPGSPYTHKQNK